MHRHKVNKWDMRHQIKAGQQKRTHGQLQPAISRQRLVNLALPFMGAHYSVFFR